MGWHVAGIGTVEDSSSRIVEGDGVSDEDAEKACSKTTINCKTYIYLLHTSIEAKEVDDASRVEEVLISTPLQ